MELKTVKIEDTKGKFIATIPCDKTTTVDQLKRKIYEKSNSCYLLDHSLYPTCISLYMRKKEKQGHIFLEPGSTLSSYSDFASCLVDVEDGEALCMDRVGGQVNTRNVLSVNT
eukprot:TRINITY_DN9720_c0_g2_i7.p1 TRINITY_DN9720_c0_g2~~TRINITY_DN9720_c0_g2_i7.p1  ORF type:complete len:113 (+),score=16.18 TRINITY_DN9720_c0_g2_i7:119-457(+)